MKKLQICVLSVLAVLSATAATYYVDRNNSNASDAANVGTEDVPFASIQAAVDKAAAGDVVKVKPGIYDNGGKTYTFTNKAGDTYNCLDRVRITKAIRLEATSSNPAATVIKGASDPEPTSGNKYGIGPNAVRCVSVGATGVVVKGFTLADGRAHALTAEGDIEAGRPGGFAPNSSTRKNYFIDGVITNCCAARGGAVRYATVVRSLIVGNTTEGGNAPGRDSNFFHCFFRRNAGAFMTSRIVNCTVVETSAQAMDATDVLWNSIFALPGTTSHGDNDSRYAKNSQLPAAYNTTDDADCFYGNDYPFVSPIRGDYRLRSDATAATLGSMASFAEAISTCGLTSGLPEGVDIYRSMDGVTLDPSNSDAICAGAFQKTTEVASGTLYFTHKIAVDGVSTFTNMYAHSLTEHDYLIFTGVGDKPLFRIDRISNMGGTYFPYCDETAAVAFPPTGYVSTNSLVYAKNVGYVDPTNGVDDLSQGYGLSPEKPFRTLQYAVDRVKTGDSNRAVIYAAAGVYEEGGMEGYGSNRVAILNRSIRLVGAGAGKSIIRGKYDDVSEKKAGDGRGPAAMRCVGSYNSYVAIEGFTFENGYSSYDPASPTGSGYDYQGGLVLLLGTSSGLPRHVLECTFRGGIAYRGSALAGDTPSNMCCHRCLFEDCSYLAGGMVRTASAVSCLARNCTTSVGGARVFDVDSSLYHTTIDLNASGGGLVAIDSIATILNCVMKGAGESYTTYKSGYRGNVVQNVSISGAVAGSSYVKADPVFVDAANGDYRVGSSSPALTATVRTTDLYRIYPLDYNGKPRRYINGKPVGGAFTEPVQTVVVSTSSYDTPTVTDGTTGTNFVEAGESLAVSYVSDGRRRLMGYVIDGETVTNGMAQYVYTAGSEVTTAGAATIAPYFSPHWYVDANNGNDGNDGFTPQTAKRTLAEAMTNCCLLAGDTVHAAAGVYRDGTMEAGFMFQYLPNTGTLCRLSVPSDITVVADGSVEETVIEGLAAPNVSMGLGAGAVRCAAVKTGGRLKGFTLRDGHTGSETSAGSNNKDDVFGGGVLGQNLGAVVENCTITNCYAVRGGGGVGAKFVNCRIVGNYGSATSSALYTAGAYGCFFDDNYGIYQVTRFLSCAYNCTFTERNWYDTTKTRKATAYICDYTSQFNLVNSIILGPTNTQSKISAVASLCNLASAAEAGLDENYRPVKGGVSIDVGSNAGVAADLNGVDAAGTQRIYNGTVDIGCYEYDWRADYVADLGVKVPAAAPGVVEVTAGQSVRLGSGEMDLLFTGGDPLLATQYTIPVTVQGAGTLTATLNGEVLTNLTSAAGAASIVFRNRETSNSLVLTYDGNDEGALVAHTSLKRNSTVMIFR